MAVFHLFYCSIDIYIYHLVRLLELHMPRGLAELGFAKNTKFARTIEQLEHRLIKQRVILFWNVLRFQITEHYPPIVL